MREYILEAIAKTKREGYITVSTLGGLTLAYGLPGGGEGSLGCFYGDEREAILSHAIPQGIMVIDYRGVRADKVAHFAIRGPIPALGRKADSLPTDGKWRGLHHVALPVYGRLAEKAGAKVLNCSLYTD